MSGILRTTVRRVRRGAAVCVLSTLFALSVCAGSGCQRGDAQASERIAAPAVTSPASEAPGPDGRRAMRDGKALGKIDRLFSTPVGTKLN
jgi:hypothetical protein